MSDLRDRMAAENTALEGRDATLDELLQVWSLDQLVEMRDDGMLTDAQEAALAQRVPAPPAL